MRRPRSSWEAKAGDVPSPLAGLSEMNPPIVITDEARERAERMLEEKTRPRNRFQTLKERNDRYAKRVFLLCGKNVARTARMLGIGRATMYRWLVRLGLEPPSLSRWKRERVARTGKA